MRVLIGGALAALLLYALACVGLYLAQRSLIYFPQPRRFGTGFELLTFKVADAELKVTARTRAGAPAILYMGGNAEDVSGSMGPLEQAFPGHALYLLHYRGYGGSSGKPSEAALFADALAMYDQLRAVHPQVTVIGRSLGSGPALHVASRRPVARLVLVTPYDSIAAIAAGQFSWFPVHWLLSDKFESFRDAPAVSAPTLILQAEHDELIPPASTRLLATHFKPGVVRYISIAGTGHNTISEGAAYVEALSGAR